MIPILGWQNTEVVKAKGLHPESNESSVIDVTSTSAPKNSNIYATLMLWKQSDKKFTNKELSPVSKIIDLGDGTFSVKIEGEPEKKIQF